MSAINPNAGACSCGQVVFDLNERKNGEVLHCSWCGRKFRYLGGERMTPLPGDEPTTNAAAAKKAPRKMTQIRKPDGPPGGVFAMVGFIIGFNALAFIALWMILPKESDGLRHAIWDADVTIPGNALWPDLAALALGHVLGFAGWAAFVYRLHRQAQTETKT